jgi:hypothetical protein
MEDLYLGPWGEVIVGGRSDYAPMVVRLDGWTGAQVWQRTLGLLLDAGVVRRVESTYSGEVYGTGYILNGSDASSLRLLAFGLEANGQVDWLRRIGDGVQYGLGNALALDAAAVQNSFTGRLYITGGMKYPGPHEDDFTLVRLKAADGSGAGYVPSLAWKTAAPSFLVDERFYAGTYEDRIELEAAIVTGFAEDPAMRDFVWTDSAADLLLHAGRQVILGPLDEAEEVVAVEWICRHREPLESERQTLAFILLQSGGRGEPMAQECLGRGESRLEEAADTGCPDSQRSEFR